MSSEPGPPHTPLITPAKAVQAARLVITELRKNPLWQPALRGATPVTSPLLVRRLDVADSYYYVVSCLNATNLSARVMIDGFSTQLVEIGGVDRQGQALAKWISGEQAITTAIANAGAWSPAVLGTLPAPLRREMMSVQPVLAWRPCLQSRSRFLPFHLVMAATRVAYVRVDGEFYTELTNDTLG